VPLHVLLVSVALSSAPMEGLSQEIRPFRLTDWGGEVFARYSFDETENKNTQDGGKTRETRPRWEEGFFLSTESYIYHPDFLNMTIGGGLTWVQSDLESNAGDNSSNDLLFNFIGRWRFIERKPYPVSVFFERLHPSVSLGLADSLTLEQTNYGGSFALREEISPVAINVDASRRHVEGDGLDVQVDDTTDQAVIRAFRSFGADSFGRLTYVRTEQESRSGSSNLPIQKSTTDTDALGWDSRLVLGRRRQFRFTNNFDLSRIDNSQSPTRRDGRALLDLRWQHSPALDSFYTYNLAATDRRNADSSNQTGVVGVNFRPHERVSGTLSMRGEDTDTDSFDEQSYGASTSINYNQPLPFGRLEASYLGSYDRNDRKSSSDTQDVIDEPHILAGTVREPLRNELVIQSTVVVTNADKTQTFEEGNDYRLIQDGATTLIQRLVGGNILDGQRVLVSYSYRTGGTFKFSSTVQAIQGNLTLLRYYNLFALYRYFDQSVRSGQPTTPLNSGFRTEVGVGADVPFITDWRIGGEARYEHLDDDFSPFDRQSYRGFLELPVALITAGRLNLGVWRELVDNKKSPEDVDLYRYSALFRARPWRRMTLTAEASHQKDTGGTLETSRDYASLGARWRMRELSFTLEARAQRDKQGDNRRDTSYVRALLKREF
jgi:hypothetical protein